MLGRIMRKTHIVSGNPRDVPVRDALYISSTRVGEVMGQHRIMIDGPFDGLELVHTARSRGGFARGALLAASWLHRRKGFYSIEDMFDDIESV
jgi:4-hydroxy-tetrahydrodipicolinate reductase